LIELLVVIAIIGILSSVVLASLNSARNKGANAAIKSNLANARAQAEIFYDGVVGNQSYTAVCTDGSGIGSNVEAAIAASGVAADTVTTNCNSDDDEWVAIAELKNSEGMFCVDYKGYSGITTTVTDASTETDGNMQCN
jgi:type II secretory pathway pseudopilin PulG